MRFVKQAYYEGGPKENQLLARRIRVQQTLNTIHNIGNPKTNELLNEPEEIKEAFEEYYRTL